MFNLKQLLGSKIGTEDENKEVDEKDIQLATSILLINIAQADEHLAQEEQKHIISVLQGKFQLLEDEAKQLFELSEQEIKDSIDIWQFTNQINQNVAKKEKLKILKYAWEVIYTDENLDPQEDYLIHKLANLLRLSHKELIETKIKVKNNEK